MRDLLLSYWGSEETRKYSTRRRTHRGSQGPWTRCVLSLECSWVDPSSWTWTTDPGHCYTNRRKNWNVETDFGMWSTGINRPLSSLVSLTSNKRRSRSVILAMFTTKCWRFSRKPKSISCEACNWPSHSNHAHSPHTRGIKIACQLFRGKNKGLAARCNIAPNCFNLVKPPSEIQWNYYVQKLDYINFCNIACNVALKQYFQWWPYAAIGLCAQYCVHWKRVASSY